MGAVKWTQASSRYLHQPAKPGALCMPIPIQKPSRYSSHSLQPFLLPPFLSPQNAFQGLGVNLSLQEVARMAREVDDNRCGHLGPEEFLQLLHMHPNLFGNSNSLQIMASAHRRAENLKKLINKPPGKSIHESEFKLPPVKDLPGRRHQHRR